MHKKTAFNQFLRDVKDRTYPNRILSRMRIHPALRDHAPVQSIITAERLKAEFPHSAQASFTEDWFASRTAWLHHFAKDRGSAREYMEIGSFEGRSLLFAADLFPHASLTAIDLFETGLEPGADVSESFAGRFYRNIEPIKHRVRVLKGRSSKTLAGLSGDAEKYDVIYIDGSHFYREVLIDTMLAWPLLKTGGILIWDDYSWHNRTFRGKDPAIAVDQFLDGYKGDYKVIFAGYQVAIRKIQSEIIYFGPEERY